MAWHQVSFTHAGPIDSSKRSGSSCETAIGQKPTYEEHQCELPDLALQRGGQCHGPRFTVRRLGAGDAMRCPDCHSLSEAVQTAEVSAIHRRAVRAARHRQTL